MSLELDAALRLGEFAYEAHLEARDEIVVLFGHSGAGKSVSLQVVAGLLRPDSGRVAFEGKTLFDSTRGIDLPPQERGVGYVVQELALFNHLTVAGNIAFGMPPGTDREARVTSLLSLLSLDGFGDRKPRTLSGGQRQRVALARALARDSRLLLLDEPFSALDEALRAGLRRELLRLRSELGLTIVFVTHDLREAHLLGDRLAVIDGGRVLQLDRRDEVFRRPASRRVAELTGVSNVFPGHVIARTGDGLIVDANGARLRCASCQPGIATGEVVDVAIRAERVNLRRGAEDQENTIEAAIREEYAYGPTHTLYFGPAGAGPSLEVEIASRPYEVLHVAKQRVWTLELPPADLHVMRRSPLPPPGTPDQSPAQGLC